MRLHQFFRVTVTTYFPFCPASRERSRTIFLLFRYRRIPICTSACCRQIPGRVGCNGLVYIRNGEAVIMDTPPDSVQSLALLRWIEKRFPGTIVKAVIVNHFHDDCLAGLPVFHRKGIPSYANAKTKTLAAEKGYRSRKTVFRSMGYNRRWTKNRKPVLGEAHTKDNIVTWIPSEHILFGGCPGKILGQCKGQPGRCQCRCLERLPAG